jgi:hypothetical protein
MPSVSFLPAGKVCGGNYFFALMTSHRIRAIMPTTTRTPTQTPALKMPSIALQPVMKVARQIK